MQLKTMTLAAVVGAAVALSGAARAADPAAQTAQQQQEQLTKGASGHQDGKLEKIEGNSLQLKPYQKKAGVANLTTTGDTKVFAFEPYGLVSSGMSGAVLNPGANVRVYYKPAPGGTLQIVAIQLLPPAEAAQMESGQSNK
ncbi:MAG TPA: hypothetical protein VGK67_21520 [Myxococcales bacterium]|jgi:hypothetical protein